MNWDALYYLLYGFVCGMSELLPVSPAAHSYLLNAMTEFPSTQPMLMLCVHFAVLIAVLINYWHRVGHIVREVQLGALPDDKQKRQPDTIAIMDAKVLKMALIPTAVGVAMSVFAYQKLAALPVLSLFLLLSGIVIYIPQYLPGANKDSRSLNPIDSLLLGAAAALGVIPGLSRVGNMLSAGLLKGCERSYMLDMVLLLSIPVLFGYMIVDVVVLLGAGVALSWPIILYALLAGGAALGGAWLAMVIMRYLVVKSNFNGFVYYNWGLALFAFLVYLMI